MYGHRPVGMGMGMDVGTVSGGMGVIVCGVMGADMS